MCKVTNQEVVAAGSEIWVKRDGTKVAVKDMCDAHVRNALTSLLKKIREKSEGPIVTEVDQTADTPDQQAE